MQKIVKIRVSREENDSLIGDEIKDYNRTLDNLRVMFGGDFRKTDKVKLRALLDYIESCPEPLRYNQ